MSLASLQPRDLAAQSSRTASMPLAVVMVMVLLAAIAQRFLVMPNANVAWLLTVAERMLDGQALYVDTIETNPPFSVWLYLPAAFLARLLHLRAELVVDAMVLALAGGAMAFSLRRVSAARLIDAELQTRFAVALGVALLVLPAACFGEREHVAAIAFVPFVTIAALRASGRSISLFDRCVNMLAMALIVIIKPHFALAIIPVLLLVMIALRSPLALFAADHIAAGLIVLAYVGSTLLIHPAFWSQVMPLVADLYLPIRYPTLDFLRQFSDLELAFTALIALSALRGWRGPEHLSTLIAAGATGFLLAVVLQGKGMPYHFYPALTFAALVAFATDQRSNEASRGISPTLLLAAGLSCVFWTWFNSGFDLREVKRPLSQAAAQPRVLALGYDFSIGPPMARAVGGTYVGRVTSQWMADNARWLKTFEKDPARRAALEAYEAQDRETFLQDLTTEKPDVLFIQRGPDDWQDFVEGNERFAAEIAHSMPAGTYRSSGMRNAVTLDYDMWVRRPELK